ncbi:MAG: hypothetical protein DHS20C01_33010 [marine bacterium B5-7]|nr:MAG: hypothetical protein DHS20C01_33010 [marine bacterium B5-7]
MKAYRIAVTALLLGSTIGTAQAVEPVTTFYLGLGATSLALDSDRVFDVPTRSPGHTPKIGSLVLGAYFNDQWAADLSLGTDLSNNVDTDVVAINGYRFFGENKWRPFVSAGLSRFDVDEATGDEQTDQIQAGFGLSGALTESVEMRVGYQHFFTVSGDSFDDDAVNVAVNWSFGKPAPAPVAAVAPAPEPAPAPAVQKKEVIDTYELLVEFDFDKSEVRSIYEPQFKTIASILNQNPDISMTIEGHTDAIGTDEYNQDLSERRAEAVRQKFIRDFNVSPNRIGIMGYGETQPIADNSTPAGRQKNRRAIAVVLKARSASQ